MGSRLELQAIFEELLESRNVYYQPPPSVLLKYPAIVYERDTIENEHANDGVYIQKTRYSATVIDPNPDSEFVYKMSRLPLCRHTRHFKSDNLNHDTFEIFF